MAVKHAHQTTLPDDPASDVSATEWNADHTVEDGTFTIAKTAGLQTELDGKQTRIGFPLHTDGTPSVTLTYSSADRKFTVTAKSGATFDLFVNGAKITTASPYTSTAHDTAVGNYFLYHDGNGFVWSTSAWDLMLHAPVGLAYYDGTNGVGFLETHTVSRDPALHRRLHEVEGTTLVSGGVLSDWLADTDTDAGCTYSISQAVIADEDLRSTISALPDGGPYTLWYRNGAGGTWTFTTGLSFPFTFGTYPRYNRNVGGTWSLADVAANDFAVFYVLATPAVTSGHGFIIVPGQQDFTTLALANADSFASLSLGTVPFQEFCVIAKVVMEAKASYTNTYNAVIKSITRLTASRSLSSSTAATQHNTLNGLQGGAPGAGEFYHLTAAEQAALHAAVTVSDTSSINLTLTGQALSADAIFGTTSGTVCQGNDSRLSDARAPTAHTHAISDVTGLQTALDGKQAAGSYQAADAQLTSLAALSYAGNASKFIRVNAGETDFELVTMAGGGDVTGQASSVDNEIALFSGTGGKTIKRATTTGILKASSGVIAAAVAGTDYPRPDVVVATLAGDQATGANTTPVTLTGLVWTYEANAVYFFEWRGTVNAAANTTGCGFQLDVSTAVTQISMTFVHQLANTGTLSGGSSVADDASLGVSSGIPTNSTDVPVAGWGMLRTAGNTGTAQLRFRSETTAAITAKAGLTLVARRVA